MNWLWAPMLRPFITLAGSASLVLNLMLLVPSLYMTQIFDRVFASRSVETLVMLTLVAALALLLAFCMDLARTRALAWCGRTLDSRLSPTTLTDIVHTAAASGGQFNTDALKDIATLRAFLTGSAVQALFDAPWLPIYLLCIALMHPMLGGLATLGAAVLMVTGVLTERLTRAPAESAMQHGREAARVAESYARGAETMVSMGMIAGGIRRWEAHQRQQLQAQQRLADVHARTGATARALRQALQIAMLALGAWLVIDAHASPGIMIGATILLARALQPVEHLIGGWKTLIEARSAWRRIDQRSRQRPPSAPLSLPPATGRLQFENVSGGAPTLRSALLRNISFTLEPGQSLGILGASAAGKSTLVRLMLGLWKPLAGHVRLDGADLTQWSRDVLGAQTGYLPQEVTLFAGTVAENIARLGEVDSDKVLAAARTAQVHDMILRLPKGYDTPLGEGGVVLSGGQRQRIALARALYNNPCLLVLDEPNVYLDAEGVAALETTLATLRERAVTTVVVAHQAALLTRMDKLAVLREGTLQDFDAPAQVLQRLGAVPLRPVPTTQTPRKLEMQS